MPSCDGSTRSITRSTYLTPVRSRCRRNTTSIIHYGITVGADGRPITSKGGGDEGHRDLEISGQDHGRREAESGTHWATRHRRRPHRTCRGCPGTGDHLTLPSAVPDPSGDAG